MYHERRFGRRSVALNLVKRPPQNNNGKSFNYYLPTYVKYTIIIICNYNIFLINNY